MSNFKSKLCAVTGFFCLIAFSTFSYADLVVVVHPSNDLALDKKQVKRIFLGKEKKFSNGSETIPINQSPNNENRTTFDNSVLGRNTSQISAYWSKLVFTGKGVPPKEVDTDADVIKLVANNKNAIGYVNANTDMAGVRTISLN